ncbi:MAG: DUF917 domain-containing protein [Candidatus Andeanibacterium colombiense]|uniref:DUF917 domain-containing protein n=1 Tax=Candidatus Andeanibacterium colombiense TaxID=3121345 RepID=A0AAJ5X693_9SPHN|nr:MAG: DUF917 domain-containing protein [Sphingomonadaceae bacterium]
MIRFERIEDLRDTARGAVLLGTGGGGDPYIGELFVGEQMRKGKCPMLIAPEDVADDAFVVCIGGIGAPTVLVEHLVSEALLLRLLARTEALFGRRVDALISAEIGGVNSIFPLALGAISGVPVVDADGSGRAVPQLEMTTYSIFGVRSTPALVMDELGNVVCLDTISDRATDELVRPLVTAMGSTAFGALYPMSGKQMRQSAVLGSITLSRRIGEAIRLGREAGDPFTQLLAYLNSFAERSAHLVFDGKITDVERATKDGWHQATVEIRSMRDEADVLTITIRNEYIAAYRNGRPIAMVPDLISILDRESAEPLTGEMLGYGQRVKVLALSADPMLRRPESLEVLGPRAFGLNSDYVPLEELV